MICDSSQGTAQQTLCFQGLTQPRSTRHGHPVFSCGLLARGRKSSSSVIRPKALRPPKQSKGCLEDSHHLIAQEADTVNTPEHPGSLANS